MERLKGRNPATAGNQNRLSEMPVKLDLKITRIMGKKVCCLDFDHDKSVPIDEIYEVGLNVTSWTSFHSINSPTPKFKYKKEWAHDPFLSLSCPSSFVAL
jgi:hypothetical protein